MLVSFLALIFLVLPPFLFVGAVIRMQRKIGWGTSSVALAGSIIAGLLFCAANTAYFVTHLDDFIAGAAVIDAYLFLAVGIAWASVVGKMGLRVLMRHKRRVH